MTCVRSDKKTSGFVSEFNTDINCLTTGLRNLFGSAVREPLKMIACLIGASIISWRLLLFSLILSPVIGYAIRKLAGSIKRANRRILEEISQLYGVLSETFNGIQTVQAYTLESHERKRFHEVSKECFHKAMRISFYSALTKPITEVMGISMISLALLAGAYLTLNQETHLFGIRMSERPIDLPSLLVFYGLLIGTTEPARKLSEIFNSIQAGLAAAGRLFPLLDQTPAIRNPTKPLAFPSRHASIAFQNVSFEYEPENQVLEDVSFDVQFGETLAIVGPNGCGKSTLLQLIPRFFDPTTGTVRIDNIDLRSFRLKDLRRRIGVVSQQADLFDDTVMENIRRGHAGASQLDVVRAAKKARAHDFIMDRLSDGYNTIVGPTGSRLSGGQRQRIALARAIIRDPEILILDEATSQIDLESERLIHQALDEFTQDRTTFIITHRLSTISLADRVLVLNQGRVEDIGTHEELLKRCSTYVRLNRLHRDQTA
ncbi:MAG: ABC transporter ATP-binding protein [Pirellulaceae bacterium]